MSFMRQATGDSIVAVAVSDLHLSDNPPVFRSNEPDWFSAMERSLVELDLVAKGFGGVPILLAGDLFHKWNPSPKLINFALKHLPHCYAVPGQHDLRHHSMDSVEDTAYWTLAQANKITPLKCGCPHPVGKLLLWGFPWGCDLFPRPSHALLEGLHTAIVHQYVWTKKCSYPGAPEEGRLSKIRSKLTGYDVAVFGDNHLGFTSHEQGLCTLINCGGFMRRNSDQRNYQPKMGLIHVSGKVSLHHLDVTKDICLEEKELPVEQTSVGFERFLECLEGLGGTGVDFREMVYRSCRGMKEGVKACVRKALSDV